ncbi:putative thioredoxin reductase [Blastopirellula marina DSM 3645]|uniref:Putative thioredoxin reductase n=1 Tax=Blastopirellula marina DSM 3645 TaxID=314230 RepID=A4A0Y8_9BACT|nr:putative thioredoxin reductase [Blastopirellula marina DSM 3645]
MSDQRQRIHLTGACKAILDFPLWESDDGRRRQRIRHYNIVGWDQIIVQPVCLARRTKSNNYLTDKIETIEGQMGSQCDVAFPVLDDEQMSAVLEHGKLVRFAADEVMFQQGVKDYPFFVIKSGEVRIVENHHGVEQQVTVHGCGEFTGDVDMLTGRAAVIGAIAKGPVEAYQLCGVRLRKLLNDCPAFSDKLLEAFQVRRKLLESSGFVGVSIIGDVSCLRTARLREFFYKNHVPHSFFEAHGEAGRKLLQELDAVNAELPVIHCNRHTVHNPSLPELAECIGISRRVHGESFDLVIVGSGPAGLAAAVYAASEGIRTLVIDSMGPGGQAGSSSKIENFLGFPSGISGSDLANRGYLQALKFGAQFIAPITVQSIETLESGEHQLTLCTAQMVKARCVLVASGVTYRQLGVSNTRHFEGAGLYYAATSVESRICENSTAVVVGGGNSAGQAAMFLAQTAQAVKIVIRGDDLGKSMSAYLCGRVLNHPKIEVLTESEIVAIQGARCVESIDLIHRPSERVTTLACAALFCFIGAQPHTKWLPESVLLNDAGYVLTGAAIPPDKLTAQWTADRPPCDLETSVPGILAAGDVRAGSTKRCGFAVGDGSMAITCVHRVLSTFGQRVTTV